MIGKAKSALKRAALRLVSEYRVNWIYACDHTVPVNFNPGLVQIDLTLGAVMKQSPTEQMRKAAGYSDIGLAGSALVDGGHPVCVAHFAQPAQYSRSTTWPLQLGEVALIDIVTEASERGKGHAVHLIRAASNAYLAKGHRRLIAFVWWTNSPSTRAFEKAGWSKIGFSLEWRRGSRWWSLRMPLFNRRSS